MAVCFVQQYVCVCVCGARAEACASVLRECVVPRAPSVVPLWMGVFVMRERQVQYKNNSVTIEG